MATRQWRFDVRVFFSPEGLSAKVDEPHLPKAASFQVPATNLLPPSLISKNWFALRRLGGGLCCQRLFESHALGAFYGQWEFILTSIPDYDNLRTNLHIDPSLLQISLKTIYILFHFATAMYVLATDIPIKCHIYTR